jgi:hypothetical protein
MEQGKEEELWQKPDQIPLTFPHPEFNLVLCKAIARPLKSNYGM